MTDEQYQHLLDTVEWAEGDIGLGRAPDALELIAIAKQLGAEVGRLRSLLGEVRRTAEGRSTTRSDILSLFARIGS